MDLIRELLLAIEAADESETPSLQQSLPNYSAHQIAEHLMMMKEAGMIEGEPALEADFFAVFRMTWTGHEFLENIRSEENWFTLKSLLKKGRTFSFEALKIAATELIRSSLRP